MTYSDFLNQFISVISFFRSWLTEVADSLITNYFFITFLGTTIFISMLFLVFNFIKNYFDSTIDNINIKNDLYKDYCLKQDIVWRWRNEHRLRLYQLKYDNYHLNKVVSNDWLHYNKALAGEMASNRFKTLIPAYRTTEKFYRPDWLDKEPELKAPTKKEREEMEKILDSF